MFSEKEKELYSRHFLLEKIGVSGQEKLKKAKVLVVGAGGLGCPILQYLTAAGVGIIGIMDGDFVSVSNLQRQTIFDFEDVGKNKAICAKKHLSKKNPYVKFEIYSEFLTKENALKIFGKYDLIVDGTDNFESRYLINDAAVICKNPFVFGAIHKFEGQISVFNYKKSGTYRCLFPNPPSKNKMPNCSEIGVLGILPGIVGCLQANEVLKIICNLEGILSDKLLCINALNLSQHMISFSKNPKINIEKLSDNTIFCSRKNNFEKYCIDKKTLKEKLNSKKPPILLDVRNLEERKRNNLGGIHIPLQELEAKKNLLKKDAHIIIYCKSGQRSQKALQILLKYFPNKKLQILREM